MYKFSKPIVHVLLYIILTQFQELTQFQILKQVHCETTEHLKSKIIIFFCKSFSIVHYKKLCGFLFRDIKFTEYTIILSVYVIRNNCVTLL